MNRPKITVLDAIMGNSKTQRLKEIMLKLENPVLYITPLLTESMTVVGIICDEDGNQVKSDDGAYMYDEDNPLCVKKFKIPNTKNKNNSKLDSLDFLVSKGYNISSTHKLFSMLTPDIAKKFLEKKYVLVVDESLSCWNNLALFDAFSDDIRRLSEDEKSDQKGGATSRTDKEVLGLIETGSIVVDPVGLLHWDTESEYVPKEGMIHYNLKILCDMKQLYLSNGKVVFWELTADLMRSFSEIYIGTYMFEASIMSHYMDVHNLEYEVIKFGHKPSFYKPYIDIVQGKMNDVGEGKFALSYSKLEGKTRVKDSTRETRNTLKKNLDNFFKNRCKTKKEFNLWTTYIDAKNSIMNSRCNINFVPYNIKATNEYRHCTSVAYLVNNFPNTFLVAMITKRNQKRKFDQDMWALSEMLQMIFRSAIRGDKEKGDESRHIKLYIPSQRMRNLLESWLNDEFEGKK